MKNVFERVDIKTPKGWIEEDTTHNPGCNHIKARRWLFKDEKPTPLAVQLNILTFGGFRAYMLTCSRLEFPPSEDDLWKAIGDFLGTDIKQEELIVNRAEDRNSPIDNFSQAMTGNAKRVSQVVKFIQGSIEGFRALEKVIKSGKGSNAFSYH